jgi:hypothetical protein
LTGIFVHFAAHAARRQKQWSLSVCGGDLGAIPSIGRGYYNDFTKISDKK